MPQTTTTLPSPVALLPASVEQELVQRLLARDERALGQLYEQYARNLFTVILRVVQDEALAQDVLQEGLLKVWLSIGSYEATRGRLFTWMVRVCCNQAIDVLRSPRHRFHRRNPSLEAAGAHYSPAPTAFYPEHIGVRELIVQLKPRQQEVMDLLYFGGCAQAETAEQLAIPLATVKTRARAALAVLSHMAR